MKKKNMRDNDTDNDTLVGIAFDDEGSRIDIFENEDDLIEFIRDNQAVIGEYSIYEMKKIYLSQDRILH